MSEIIQFKPKPATDHKWRSVGDAGDGKMIFEYHSIQEQRLADLESGKAIPTPEEDATLRRIFRQQMGIKDADELIDAAAKDNERIKKKLENKSLF